MNPVYVVPAVVLILISLVVAARAVRGARRRRADGDSVGAVEQRVNLLFATRYEATRRNKARLLGNLVK